MRRRKLLAFGPGARKLAVQNSWRCSERPYRTEAARAVGDLRVESAGAVENRIPPEGDVLADVLRSEPILGQLGSLGLAGLLRRAHDYYAGAGHPVPEAVKVLLSITFSRELLDRARVVVDSDAEGNVCRQLCESCRRASARRWEGNTPSRSET